MKRSRTLAQQGLNRIVAAVVAVSIPPGDAAARFHVPADNLEMEQ